ncbi:sensor histidine kinase [Pseudomonas sp. TKO26]|uniref:hybrid sensor histidine kinase/response regulator n=1 Tax=unclassified Pseudomonas TaxID=196821 RepID=UPI000D9A7136|nr:MULTISPECIES: hybrid sensor histidine kinase/response regulator [unclassified Pseudomonas]PYY79429.1 sensor histidine kinase [Pseudomonas sp. TKO29]PYY84069.1 sensor histidine kinase [Pseudomonas sp. TKO30]PYY88379.1 sensor histidine kinase [Pseudomonas sp. TKO26]PYY98670.1 sensor histidine kinase [Pseudomonas sp. TKO14]
MKYRNTLMENLTRSSIHLNRGLLILAGLVLLLFAILFWTTQRLIDEQNNKVRLHFTRLMENIQEQERFLQKLASRQSSAALLAAALPARRDVSDVSQNHLQLLLTPLGLSFGAQPQATDVLPKTFALGLQLSTFYNAFWSMSPYHAPRSFLLNSFGNYDISLPAARHARGNPWQGNGSHDSELEQVLQQLRVKNNGSRAPQVHWQTYRLPASLDIAPKLLAYINLHLGPQQLQLHGANSWMMVASLLDLDKINDIERLMERSLYDDFTLIEPSGSVLSGSPPAAKALREGPNFGLRGMVFKVTSPTPALWTGLYSISYRSYLGYALWLLLSLLALAMGAIACGWIASRWYRDRVVAPAQLAHQTLAESEAFSRVVLDTAPTGLCVVRREDFKVLMENRQAVQWPGTSQLLSLLQRDLPLSDSSQTCLEIEGRHLQVGLVATRYQGQDVLLCTFNDITAHVQDAQLLEQARLAADAANQAKTLFLATMSHEIRTPLYGVLGTLELLGLTSLDARQNEYLQTIQRSSSNLFQLISDVLDVSKIESGQMNIEPVEFCPLDMVEEALRSYAAFAERRGLLLYACIDPSLPNLMRGDAGRIRQILNNLLSNAIKFTDSGRVVLRVRVLAQQDSQASIEWQVTDTGIGISPSQQPQLFAPFYQVRDASNEAGAGLGLAICQRLGEMMGGQIQVISEPGLGSSFSLRLNLQCLAGALPGAMPVPEGPPVYVRAPVPELQKNTCEWLNRLGLQAYPMPLGADDKPRNTVLIDMLPRDSQPGWPGPCVTAGAVSHRDHRLAQWTVDAHDIRTIAQAAALARQGQPLDLLQRPPDTLRRLALNVLVAEDNPLNRTIIREQLEALGCQVTLASNGEQALEQWQPQLFDIAVTDVNMPLMNGYDLARELRRREPNLPIIGVTANALREEGNRCLAAGMSAWIVKPMALQTLRGQLEKLCPEPDTRTAAPVAIRPAVPVQPRQPAPAEQRIQVSEKMRPLFLSTMHDDLQRLAKALDTGSGQTAAERLHSIAGAMGAVQAGILAKACAELECQLLENTLNPTLEGQVRQLMQHLSELLLPLE